MSKKKIVIDDLGEGSFYDVLNGKTFDEVIARMEQYKSHYSGRDVYFDIQGYGYDGGIELCLRERRLETDREYEKRIAKENLERAKKRAAEKKKKDREYAEYVRLKEKFGDV